MTTRKRLIKLARQIPESELIEFFTSDGQSVSDWSVKNGVLICNWNGKEALALVHDEVLAFALRSYLEQHRA